ncbi:MAG TPA: RNA polymerase factor sigma-54 [Pseudogracilibacillus sp.]|nr:RNA polymerase factor sigma-54 [Pseudogracilibacillus sp.]
MKIMLEQKPSLQMVMTAELRQAIELLQLTNYDLRKFIEKEAEKNPFIEIIEREERPIIHQATRTYHYEQDVDPLDFVSQENKSLYEHLIRQVNLLRVTKEMHSLLSYLISNINESGYLPISNEALSKEAQVPEWKVERARNILLKLEPLGIGAYDVSESLLVQAEEKYPEDVLLHATIEHHLENLANRRWATIAESLHISKQEVVNLLEKIQTLQPKPAMNFTSKETTYVTPDIIVHYDEEKDVFSISLNDYYVPDIRFNDEYVRKLLHDQEAERFVQEQYRRFHWLRQSVEQRRKTILNIMNVILNRQRTFFKEGFRGLNVLTLQDVATELNIHESTVSRATRNKMIETPNGTFELRRLFSTGIKNSIGRLTSQAKIKQLLKEIIQKENKAKPLSDQKIADRLKQDYRVKVSRRTVAKYRDQLKIPSSARRKQLMKSSS